LSLAIAMAISVSPPKRGAAGQHLEAHHPEGVKIGPCVRFHTLHLLRAEISGACRAPSGVGEVEAEASAALAIPKSATLTRISSSPSSSNKMLAGLISRVE